MSPVLLAILGYVLAQLAIGAYVSRRIQTEDDYLIAGRKLGYGLTTFTIFATWFGAETCIGAAGAIYEDGLSGGTADPFGYALCIFLMGLIFAVPIWKLRLTTLADLFRRRFSVAVERTAVALMIPTSLFWAAAQVRAFGQVLSASSGLEVSVTITVAAVVVIAYTLFGGLLADAWTDLIQGITLIGGLVLLFVIVLGEHGTAALAQIEPERLQLFGQPGTPLLEIIEAWSIPVIGSVTAAELLTRAIAARAPEVAQRSAFAAGGIYLLVGLIPVTMGLMGAVLLPEIGDAEQVLPLLAQTYLPTFVYALFAGAIVSAILSTVDSTLLVSASLLSHNIVVPLLPRITEAQKVRVARSAVMVFGLLAYVMALYAEGVYALVEEASAFGSAGIVVIVVAALFSQRGGPRSALAALLVGVAVWIGGAYLGLSPYPYLTSLAAAVLAYLVGALFERAAPVEAVQAGAPTPPVQWGAA